MSVRIRSDDYVHSVFFFYRCILSHSLFVVFLYMVFLVYINDNYSAFKSKFGRSPTAPNFENSCVENPSIRIKNLKSFLYDDKDYNFCLFK